MDSTAPVYTREEVVQVGNRLQFEALRPNQVQMQLFRRRRATEFPQSCVLFLVSSGPIAQKAQHSRASEVMHGWVVRANTGYSTYPWRGSYSRLSVVKPLSSTDGL